MSRIPEIIDLDTQAERLTEMLGNNQDFARIRGKCGDSLLYIGSEQMRNKDKSAKAPSAGVNDLKQFLTSFANVRGKIAQLERDGYKLAANEALEALCRPGYHMIGEIYPMVNARPITLVMFNPTTTLAVLRKSQPGDLQTSWKILYQRDLPENFPVMEKRPFFYCNILEALNKLNEPMLERVTQKIAKIRAKYIDLPESIVIPYNEKKQLTKRAGNAFAFVFAGKREDILRCFSHEDAEKIATWQFYLPEALIKRDLTFGLHLEAERDYWERKRAPFCSLNTNQGYSAIVNPGQAYHCFDKKSRKHRGTRILLMSV